MNVSITRWSVRLLLVSVLMPVSLDAAPVLRFFAMGDLPYWESEHLLLDELLDQELRQRPPFMVHVGDVKGGREPCTEAALARIADLFQSQPFPVVYTPGDNDWTDCRRAAAGGYDPEERLALLRHLIYSDPSVLRLAELGAVSDDQAFPENFSFLYQGVLFATVHLVGSRNNLNPSDPQAQAEHEMRSAANQRHLDRVIAAANAADASAMVLVFHANPSFEAASPPQGYGPFLEDLARLLRGYPGPVLAIHGDTHRYKFDHPMRNPDTGREQPRFTRLEVPGSPVVAGVWVTIDAGAAEPFAVELAYPDAREGLMGE